MGVRDTIAKALMGIKAYHSSPHDFDKFDLKKIGTGEGAQVYGHGLYFAENPAVSGQGGQYWDQFMSRMPPDEQAAAGVLRNEKFDRQKAIEYSNWNLQQLREGAGKGELDPHMMKLYEQRQRQHELLLSGNPVGPRTYEVNIKADPAQMLDWDKPLAQQGILDALSGSRRASVQDVLNRIGWQKPTRDVYGTDIGPVTGQDFYKALSYDLTGKPNSAQASKAIAAGGVPGIRYLDEGSRGVPTAIADIERAIKQGGMYKGASPDMWASRLDELKATPLTSNYVVFDPANIEIMKKYGVVGAPAGALGMGGLMQQDQYEASQ